MVIKYPKKGLLLDESLKTKEGIHRNHFNKKSELKICKTCGARQPRIKNQIRFISISLKLVETLISIENKKNVPAMKGNESAATGNISQSTCRKDLRSQHFLAPQKCENDVK